MQNIFGYLKLLYKIKKLMKDSELLMKMNIFTIKFI